MAKDPVQDAFRTVLTDQEFRRHMASSLAGIMSRSLQADRPAIDAAREAGDMAGAEALVKAALTGAVPEAMAEFERQLREGLERQGLDLSFLDQATE